MGSHFGYGGSWRIDITCRVTVQYMPQILKRYENLLQNIKVLLGFIAMNSVLYLNLLQNMLKSNLPDDVCAC